MDNFMIFHSIINDRFCVYFHILDDQIFYIGSGRLPRAFEAEGSQRSFRWHEFRKNRPVTVEIYETFKTCNEARRKEYELIRAFRPYANVVGARKATRVKGSDKKPKKGKILQVTNIRTGETALYASGIEASKGTGVSRPSISRCLHGSNISVHGFSFDFVT